MGGAREVRPGLREPTHQQPLQSPLAPHTPPHIQAELGIQVNEKGANMHGPRPRSGQWH